MNDLVKVSVIVPVYNAEEYIDECVSSIVGQTYDNLEIILIDDGSNDQSPAICDRWERIDTRIKIFHTLNRGVSIARNYGMQIVTGEYLMFVDADDWIDSDTVKHAVEVAVRDNCDIVFWPFIRETQSAKQMVSLFDESMQFEESEIKSVLVRKLIGPYGEEAYKPEQMDWCSTVWGKLYRMSLILDNGLKFVDLEKIGTFEDGLFNIQAFSKAHNVIYLNRNYYHYRRLKTGQLTSTYHREFCNQRSYLYSLLNQICDESGCTEYYVALRNRIAIEMSALALNITRDSEAKPTEKAKRIKDALKSKMYRDALEGFDISGMPFHWRIFYFFCKKRFGLCVYLIACLMNRLKEKRNG